MHSVSGNSSHSTTIELYRIQWKYKERKKKFFLELVCPSSTKWYTITQNRKSEVDKICGHNYRDQLQLNHNTTGRREIPVVHDCVTSNVFIQMKLYRIISSLTFTQNIKKASVIQPGAKSLQKCLLEVWRLHLIDRLNDLMILSTTSLEEKEAKFVDAVSPILSVSCWIMLWDESSVQSLLLYYPLVFIYGFVSRETAGSVTHNIRMGTRGSEIERPEQQIHEYKSISLFWVSVSYYTPSRCCTCELSTHNENMMTGLNEYNSNQTSVQSLKDLYLLSPLES